MSFFSFRWPEFLRVGQAESFCSRRWVRISALVLAAFLALAVLCAINTFVQKRSWRAVFLANGQVYFGKFVPPSFFHHGVLTDIYYLQVNKPLQQPSTPAPQGVDLQNPSSPTVNTPAANTPNAKNPSASAQDSVLVVKLGNEFHGPQDKMVIPSTSLLFWEDLREDSDVVSTINRAENVRSK